MATFVFGKNVWQKKEKGYMKTRIIRVIKIAYLSLYVSIITLSIFHEEAHGH